MPWTNDKVKDALQLRYEQDELGALGMLGLPGSVSCAIFVEVGLTRSVVRAALAELEGCRAHQTALCGILCATRFKYGEEGELLPTTCGKCSAEDGFEHLVACVGLVLPEPSLGPTPTVAFPVKLAESAHQVHAGIPIPRRRATQREVELEMSRIDTSKQPSEPVEISLSGELSDGAH